MYDGRVLWPGHCYCNGWVSRVVGHLFGLESQLIVIIGKGFENRAESRVFGLESQCMVSDGKQ